VNLSEKVLACLPWLPAYVWQRWTRRATRQGPVHLMLCLADHFEPSVLRDEARVPAQIQEQRLEHWCREIPRALKEWRDADGFPLRHTYFYPAEQFDRGLIERLAQHCREGWGEIEIHLHHGIKAPDTLENTRQVLLTFRDALACRGCLSQWDGHGEPRYAFVHGNFALANSHRNKNCGVDAEMKILADTGCYADFTLPSAPNPNQVTKINALYECSLPLEKRSPHRKGKDLRLGVPPQLFPLILQGPLMWDLSRRKRGLPFPAIENGELTTPHPATAKRLSLWRRAAITVVGRPEWIFIKLHCHGMNPNDGAAMFGEPMKTFLRGLVEGAKSSGEYQVHFVTAREMTNLILSACDGREGSPGSFRDYRLKPLGSRKLLRPVSVAPQKHHERALNTCAE
jgi:hypothetical protein